MWTELVFSLRDPCFLNPFPTHTTPPGLTWNARCSQGTAGSGGPRDGVWSPRLEGGGSALGLSGSPILPPQCSACFPSTYRLFLHHVPLPCFRPHQSPVPPALSRPPTLDLAVSIPSVRPQARPLPPRSLSWSLSRLALLPHACTLWGLQRVPA